VKFEVGDKIISKDSNQEGEILGLYSSEHRSTYCVLWYDKYMVPYTFYDVKDVDNLWHKKENIIYETRS
jgi:hypothetical protein